MIKGGRYRSGVNRSLKNKQRKALNRWRRNRRNLVPYRWIVPEKETDHHRKDRKQNPVGIEGTGGRPDQRKKMKEEKLSNNEFGS
jgi:hypothetical protein